MCVNCAMYYELDLDFKIAILVKFLDLEKLNVRASEQTFFCS